MPIYQNHGPERPGKQPAGVSPRQKVSTCKSYAARLLAWHRHQHGEQASEADATCHAQAHPIHARPKSAPLTKTSPLVKLFWDEILQMLFSSDFSCSLCSCVRGRAPRHWSETLACAVAAESTLHVQHAAKSMSSGAVAGLHERIKYCNVAGKERLVVTVLQQSLHGRKP